MTEPFDKLRKELEQRPGGQERVQRAREELDAELASAAAGEGQNAALRERLRKVEEHAHALERIAAGDVPGEGDWGECVRAYAKEALRGEGHAREGLTREEMTLIVARLARGKSTLPWRAEEEAAAIDKLMALFGGWLASPAPEGDE